MGYKEEIQERLDKLKNKIYKDPGKIPGGLASGKTSKNIADKHNVPLQYINSQINKGIDIEGEHTTDDLIAQEIAMDHEVEKKDYYDKLKQADL